MSASEEEGSELPLDPEGDAPAQSDRPRRPALTPEQRRFMGTRRPSPKPASQPSPSLRETAPAHAEPRSAQEDTLPPAAEPAAEESRPHSTRTGGVAAQAKAWRALELHRALIIILVLAGLFAVFYAGRKVDQVKYLIQSRRRAAELDRIPDKFPGVSTDALIETGILAQKRGDWMDGAERLMAAKRRNLAIPGILFVLGKTSFERGDLDAADVGFGHAIRFNENLPEANYYRGLIAMRRHDYAAASRFFEAAAASDPFVADFFFFWGETLRLDHHPTDAIRRYEQAARRSANADDATLCEFKMRLARIEAGDVDKLRQELAERRSAGPLSVDWLMTDAALQIHTGEVPAAVPLINEARARGMTGLFLTTSTDALFRTAAEGHSEISSALGTVAAPSQ